MWWALFFLPWMVSATAQAQTVLVRDCQTTSCSFRADIPPTSPPVALCRLYNVSVLLVEVPPADAATCDFPNVTLIWGNYRLTARTVGAAGQSSADSNWIDLNSAVPPPPPPPPVMSPPSGLRII